MKLLTIVYEDDETNDHRMANDIFNTLISIPALEKDYLRVRSNTISGYDYLADHALPNISLFDALDYHAYYRLLDAMCDYVFNGNLSGKEVALGNGSTNQVSMPGDLDSLIQSETPTFANAQSTYLFPCNSSQNPRQSYCDELASVSETPNKEKVVIFPNPTNTLLHIESEIPISNVYIYNQQGQLLKTTSKKTISINHFARGLYNVKIIWTDNSYSMQKIIKQ